MSLLDWLVVLGFLIIVILGHLSITAVTLAALVLAIVVLRVLRGERL